MSIRLRRAPPRLLGAWIVAAVLVLAGLFAAITWLDGTTESTSLDGPTLGQPSGGDAATTAPGHTGQRDVPGGRSEPDDAASPAIADELSESPASTDVPDASEGDDSGPAAGPDGADDPATTTTGSTTTPAPGTPPSTAPPAGQDDEGSGGLLDALIELLSGGS